MCLSGSSDGLRVLVAFFLVNSAWFSCVYSLFFNLLLLAQGDLIDADGGRYPYAGGGRLILPATVCMPGRWLFLVDLFELFCFQ